MFPDFFSRTSQTILNVLLQSLVLSAQTSCISEVLCTCHYTIQASANIPHKHGTTQKYVSPLTEILLYSATTSFFPPVFPQNVLSLPLERRRKQENSTENYYGSEEYVSNIREWWITETTGLIHSDSSSLSSVFL